MKKRRIELALFIAAVAVILAVRLYVQATLPVLPLTEASSDDVLMLRYADRLASLHWMGPYSFSSMLKLPGYAVFLAAGRLLRLPYMTWYGLLWCTACLVFLLSVRGLFRYRGILAAVFALLLFYPPMLDSMAQRIYNSAIIPSVAVFAASGCLGAFVRRDRGLGSMAPWLLLSAFTYAFYCIVRFDVQWLTALLAGAGLMILFSSWKAHTAGKRLLLLFLLILPFILAFAGKTALSLVNQKAYGLRVVSDFDEGNFAQVCHDLVLIDDENEDPEVYVSKEAFGKAFAQSETLTQLQPLIEKEYEERSYSMLNENGEFSREYYAWYIRAMAETSGYYRDMAETEKFFGDIHRELEDAFKAGRLQKKQGLFVSPFSGLLTMDRLPRILAHSLTEGVLPVLLWRYTGAAYNAAPDGEVRQLYDKILNQKVPAQTSTEEEVAGYNRHISAVNRLHDIWRILGPVLAAAAFIFFLLQAVLLIPAKTRPLAGGSEGVWLLIAQAGILMAMWANLFILSANFYMFGDGVFTQMRFYAGGASALWMVFAALSLGTGADRCLSHLAAKKNKEVQ